MKILQCKWSKRKWLEAPLNFIEIKKSFGSFQTNPQANAWWVVLLIFLKKCFSETPYSPHPKISLPYPSNLTYSTTVLNPSEMAFSNGNAKGLMEDNILNLRILYLRLWYLRRWYLLKWYFEFALECGNGRPVS